MPRRKAIETVRLQLTVSKAIDDVLGDMGALGIQGRNKAEVASWIISNWLWDNEDRLNRNGISLIGEKGDG